VIVAGYPKEMRNFLDSNPGLKSRFKHHFEFSDYLPQELSHIADIASQRMGVKFTPDAKSRLNEIIVNAYRNRDRTFGNARFVFDLIEKAKVNLGLRIMNQEDPKSLDKEVLETVILEDIAAIDIKPSQELPHIPIDEDLLHESMDELNRLIGLDKVKEQIIEHVRLVRYYRETSRDVLNSFYLHTVLIGNPGTGKTTIARILTKIYKALGILERGHMVETDRQGLVAGFVGQTAIKTTEKIDEAMGGVLFIDEAYSLTLKSQSGNDFGDEAIQTILKRMEDNRGRFFVFVAGYPDNMEAFLKANPGLSSRFDKVLKFDDYSATDLFKIALLMFEEKGIVPAPEAEEHLEKYFSFLYNYRDKYFGNARSVRQVVIEAIKNQNLRLAALTPDERENVSANILILEDVANFKLDTSNFIFNKKGIGFRRSGE
ncbi:MAG: AAA family ATPase, partial [Saprospiraceae bacterium]